MGKACIVILILFAAAAVRPQGDEEKAAELFERAQELCAKGSHRKAFSTFEKLAERYPDTREGRTARRRIAPNALLGWTDVMRHGPSENRVDFVLMGDGYVLHEQDAFDDIAADVPRIFERDSVFSEYLEYVNLIRANVVSVEEGIDGYGRQANTALDAKVWHEAEQGQVIVNHGLVHEVLGEMGVDDGQAIVVVPLGHAGTGGAGVAAVGGRNFKTMIHEIGHSFAALGDEYDDHTVPRLGVPHRLNVSSTEDLEAVPWRHWVDARVPGIGAYEGADGRVRGAWKPTTSCRMGSGEFFCKVCREALVLRIYDYVDPIDAATPPPTGPEEALTGAEPHELEVVVMRPASHVLEVRWWVLPEDEAPAPRTGRFRYRKERGKLAPIHARPVEVNRLNKKGVHRFRLDPEKLEPGVYRVIVRARDTTELRGERWPWVLRDEWGVLESERSWRVVVE